MTAGPASPSGSAQHPASPGYVPPYPPYSPGAPSYPTPPGVLPPSLPPGAPPPPPGPGVQAPFVAPPTDGARQRRWWAVGLSIGTAMLCCLGSLVGTGGLVVLGSQMVIESTQAAVSHYLDAVRVGDYKAAYALLCDAEQSRRSEAAFTEDVKAEPPIASFQVAEPIIDNSSEEIRVPATVRYQDGTSDDFVYYVVQDRSTAEFEVCGRSG